MKIDSKSYFSLLKDVITICKAIENDDISAEIKAIAKQRLALLEIVINMSSELALPEERAFWQNLKQIMKGI